MTSNLPKTFKAAVFEKQGGPLVLQDLPLEQPKAGEVLVKVLANGVCHSDALVQEGSNDVAAIGLGETVWKVGDRVGAGWHGGHCGHCKQCRLGMFQMCENETINGVFRNGGYAEYVLLRTEAVVHVPKDVDPAAFGPMLCAGVTTFNSIRHMNVRPGELVAIQGLGGLGHLAIQYADKMGFNVVALSTSADKEKFAKELGAAEYIDSSKEDPVGKLKSMGGAALIVATAPNPKAIAPLVNALGAGGKLLVLAPCGEIPVNTAALIQYGSSVHGWPSGASLDSEEAVSFAKLHHVNCMIDKFPLKDAQKAFDHMLSGKARFRCVLVMD